MRVCSRCGNPLPGAGDPCLCCPIAITTWPAWPVLPAPAQELAYLRQGACELAAYLAHDPLPCEAEQYQAALTLYRQVRRREQELLALLGRAARPLPCAGGIGTWLACPFPAPALLS
jgi:hypothetical protein